MLKRIKYSLNNENGGPQLEYIIGVGVSTSLIVALWSLGRVIHDYYYATPSIKTLGNKDSSIIIGYRGG